MFFQQVVKLNTRRAAQAAGSAGGFSAYKGSYSGSFSATKPLDPEPTVASDGTKLGFAGDDAFDNIAQQAEKRSPLKVQWWMKDRWQCRFDRPNEENVEKKKEKTFFYPMEPDAAQFSRLEPVYYYTNLPDVKKQEYRNKILFGSLIAIAASIELFWIYSFTWKVPREAEKAQSTWEARATTYKS